MVFVLALYRRVLPHQPAKFKKLFEAAEAEKIAAARAKARAEAEDDDEVEARKTIFPVIVMSRAATNDWLSPFTVVQEERLSKESEAARDRDVFPPVAATSTGTQISPTQQAAHELPSQ